MEDSEKRKQMLKAMRMEAAAQNDGSTGPETSMNTAHLSNPLAETSSHQQESYETPRFDYYTDPMSAYSSFKRNKTSPQQQYISSPRYQASSPAPQFPPSLPGSLGNDYQAHGGFQADHYEGQNMHMEPRGMAHFSPSHRGPPPAAWNNNFRPPPVHHLGPPPAAWNNNFRPPGPPPYNHLGPPPQWVPRTFPPSQESHDMGNNRFGGRGRHNSTAPQFSHYGRQNSNWSGNTHHDSGRGRSRGRGGFGRDGGRRPMESGGDSFYSNSMAEDPWKHLKPLLWKSCSDSSSSNSTGQAWLPNSIAQKKPVISEASHKPSSNQQSLAEYLAASLDEATCDDPSN